MLYKSEHSFIDILDMARADGAYNSFCNLWSPCGAFVVRHTNGNSATPQTGKKSTQIQSEILQYTF